MVCRGRDLGEGHPGGGHDLLQHCGLWVSVPLGPSPGAKLASGIVPGAKRPAVCGQTANVLFTDGQLHKRSSGWVCDGLQDRRFNNSEVITGAIDDTFAYRTGAEFSDGDSAEAVEGTNLTTLAALTGDRRACLAALASHRCATFTALTGGAPAWPPWPATGAATLAALTSDRRTCLAALTRHGCATFTALTSDGGTGLATLTRHGRATFTALASDGGACLATLTGDRWRLNTGIRFTHARIRPGIRPGVQFCSRDRGTTIRGQPTDRNR